MALPSEKPNWLDALIIIGAGLFIFALFLSAVFEPSIRLLHTLQALIYVAVIILTRRRHAWAFGAGCIIAVFWNYINLFVTTFIKAGIHQASILVQTGQIPRPDLFLAVIAALGHSLLIVACLIGFIRTRPSLKQAGQFFGGGAMAVGYLVLIIITTGPQYIGVLKRTFRL